MLMRKWYLGLHGELPHYGKASRPRQNNWLFRNIKENLFFLSKGFFWPYWIWIQIRNLIWIRIRILRSSEKQVVSTAVNSLTCPTGSLLCAGLADLRHNEGVVVGVRVEPRQLHEARVDHVGDSL
jgi:hypothetical protein